MIRGVPRDVYWEYGREGVHYPGMVEKVHYPGMVGGVYYPHMVGGVYYPHMMGYTWATRTWWYIPGLPAHG